MMVKASSQGISDGNYCAVEMRLLEVSFFTEYNQHVYVILSRLALAAARVVDSCCCSPSGGAILDIIKLRHIV